MTSCNQGDKYHLNKVTIIIVTVKGNKSRGSKKTSASGDRSARWLIDDWFGGLSTFSTLMYAEKAEDDHNPWESSSRATAHHKEIG